MMGMCSGAGSDVHKLSTHKFLARLCGIDDKSSHLHNIGQAEEGGFALLHANSASMSGWDQASAWALFVDWSQMIRSQKIFDTHLLVACRNASAR